MPRDNRDDAAADARYFEQLRAQPGVRRTGALSSQMPEDETAVPSVDIAESSMTSTTAAQPEAALSGAAQSDGALSGTALSGTALSDAGLSDAPLFDGALSDAGLSDAGLSDASDAVYASSAVRPSATMTAAPAAVPVSGPTEWITCPDCGEGAMIDPLQRRADDFCTNCDFPLFWARSAILASATDETGASLRRLPGTEGRAAAAGVMCPHCGEPNSPTALICIRCSGPMVIVEQEPEPVLEPKQVFVPEPELEPEPEPDSFIIWLVALCLLAALLIVLGVWNTMNS